jgi:hypothetical protein
MQHTFKWTILSLLLASGLSSTFSACQESQAQRQVNEFNLETLRIDFENESITFKNLRLYPIYASDALATQMNQYGNYVSLDEALKLNKIEISEKSINGRSDEVNKLYVENKSNDTLILLAGEIVKGGKQDRTLSDDVVLAPKSGKVDLDVFCVEHGRWDEKAENVVANMPMEEKKFKMTTAMVKPSVRKNAVVDKSQGKVWQKVDEVNTKANQETETAAYTAFDENVDYKKQEKEYADYFDKHLPKDSKWVGVIAVSGSSVIGCDVFVTHDLFIKSWSKLLPSYINEAIYDGGPVTIKASEVKAYAQKVFGNTASQNEFLTKNGKLYKHKGRVLHLTSY